MLPEHHHDDAHSIYFVHPVSCDRAYEPVTMQSTPVLSTEQFGPFGAGQWGCTSGGAEFTRLYIYLL